LIFGSLLYFVFRDGLVELGDLRLKLFDSVVGHFDFLFASLFLLLLLLNGPLALAYILFQCREMNGLVFNCTTQFTTESADSFGLQACRLPRLESRSLAS